eukprot:SAG31_NODE_1341_length_8708_cov_10.945174_3_plen_77_part_00
MLSVINHVTAFLSLVMCRRGALLHSAACEQRWGSLYHEVADAQLFSDWNIDWVWCAVAAAWNMFDACKLTTFLVQV